MMKRRPRLRVVTALAALALGLAGCTVTDPLEPKPERSFESHPVNNRPSSCKGWVALTLDDGPSELTFRLLEVLREYEVSATFFDVGVAEQRYPDRVRAIKAGGHEIANHTMTHADLLSLPAPAALKEITDASAVHQELDLPKQRLFRPPYGSTSPELRATVERLGMIEVLWTVDSKDYETMEADKVFEQSKGMEDGGIVLLHDGKVQTLEALPSIITYYQDKGLCWGVIGRGEVDVPTDAGLPHVARAMAPWGDK